MNKSLTSSSRRLSFNTLKILPLYFTEMCFLTERREISHNRRFNLYVAAVKIHICTWHIPQNAQKPMDGRTLRGKQKDEIENEI